LRYALGGSDGAGWLARRFASDDMNFESLRDVTTDEFKDFESDPEGRVAGVDNAIDAAAADWVACLDRGVLSAADQAALTAWLAADVRHGGALARAQAVFATLDRAKALGADFGQSFEESSGDSARGSFAPPWVAVPPPEPARATSRRAALGLGGMAAAAAAVGVFIAPRFWHQPPPQPQPQQYASKKGEIKLVSLTDESVLTMNTQSHVSVDYTGRRRGVELMEGEVLFSVAKDSERPFAVTAGDIEVRAVGTSFVVRRMDGAPPEVLVQEGVVDVAYRSAPETVVRAAANTRVVTTQGHLVKSMVDADDLARATAWRQGMIAFEGVSLRTAAQEFSRYSDMRIVIDDPAIANTTITGLFAATNPAGFGFAVATSLGLKVEVGEDRMRLHN